MLAGEEAQGKNGRANGVQSPMVMLGGCSRRRIQCGENRSSRLGADAFASFEVA